MRRKTRGQEFDQLLQNLKAAAFSAKYFAHAWSGQLVFITGTSSKLKSHFCWKQNCVAFQASGAGWIWLYIFVQLLAGLTTITDCSPTALHTKCPLGKKSRAQTFPASIRCTATLKSSLCLLMSAILQENPIKQQKTNKPKKRKHLKIARRKVLRPQYPRHTWNITKLIDYKHSLLRLGK